MKLSEARILVYLSVAKKRLTYGMKIAAKLKMDYKYCLEVIGMMVEKGWVIRDSFPIKTYYCLTKKAPLEDAKNTILMERKGHNGNKT